jgi:hypothetical protein
MCFRLYQMLWKRLLRQLKGSEPMPLNVGVLIIGSLLWDEERQAWRKARLDMTSAQTVTAPIRYGRCSSSRGRTYTMVLSRLCQIGQAKVVSCFNTVSSTTDLIAEAEHLWKAEQPTAKAGQIAAEWGCVALLCNPERKVPEDILKAWAERVGREPDYGNVSQTQGEGILVSKDGMLRIDWPRLVDSGAPVRLDLLLVTANDPRINATSPSYPPVDRIVNAWNADTENRVEYFWRNLDNGICTFQDDEITARLRPREGQ